MAADDFDQLDGDDIDELVDAAITGIYSERARLLTFAATTAYAGKAAAAEPSGLDVALVNHVSYTCPDYRRAADWYSMVFNLEQIGAIEQVDEDAFRTSPAALGHALNMTGHLGQWPKLPS